MAVPFAPNSDTRVPLFARGKDPFSSSQLQRRLPFVPVGRSYVGYAHSMIE